MTTFILALFLFFNISHFFTLLEEGCNPLPKNPYFANGIDKCTCNVLYLISNKNYITLLVYDYVTLLYLITLWK